MNRTPRWLTAAALALTLPLLAACDSTEEPPPSPSTSPTISEEPTPSADAGPAAPPTFNAPASEEEAADAATETVVAFNDAYVPILAYEDFDALELYLAGDILEDRKEQLQLTIDNEIQHEGSMSFEPRGNVTVSDNPRGDSSIPFGLASVTGCQDTSEHVLTDGQGNPLDRDGSERNIWLYDLAFEPENEIWRILSAHPLEGSC